MKKFLVLTGLLLAQSLSLPLAFAAGAPAPAALPNGSKVFFVSPKDGTTVSPKFTVKFNVEGMKLAKAGDMKVGTGHHHLLVDAAAIPAGEVVPKDATHIHLGNMQTETELTLAPGQHTLTLQFADGAHMSYGPAMSQTITVQVK